jgi:hypothetical protein
MKKKLILIGLSISCFLFSSYTDNLASNKKKVNFYVSGTGSKGITVKLGIGPQIGSGSCCYPLSPSSSMVRYSAEEGDVLYDSERNRVIVKVNTSMEGSTINLKDFY